MLDGGLEGVCVEAVCVALLLLDGLQVPQIHHQAPGLGYLHSSCAKIILTDRENRDVLGKVSKISQRNSVAKCAQPKFCYCGNLRWCKRTFMKEFNTDLGLATVYHGVQYYTENMVTQCFRISDVRTASLGPAAVRTSHAQSTSAGDSSTTASVHLSNLFKHSCMNASGSRLVAYRAPKNRHRPPIRVAFRTRATFRSPTLDLTAA